MHAVCVRTASLVRLRQAVSWLPRRAPSHCGREKQPTERRVDARRGWRCIAVLHMRPRAHNLISYTLALLVFAAVFGARALSSPLPVAPVALLAALLWCFHFARRAGESAWVHRYGKGQRAHR